MKQTITARMKANVTSNVRKDTTFKRTRTVFFSLTAVLVLGVAGFFTWQGHLNNQSDAATCPASPYEQYGSTGTCVKYLQQLANGISSTGSTISTDGIFGSGTKTKVKAVQAKYGLTQDGIAGPKTWGKLCTNSSNRTAASNAGCNSGPTVLYMGSVCPVAGGYMTVTNEMTNCAINYNGYIARYYQAFHDDYRDLCNLAHTVKTSIYWNSTMPAQGMYTGFKGMCVQSN